MLLQCLFLPSLQRISRYVCWHTRLENIYTVMFTYLQGRRCLRMPDVDSDDSDSELASGLNCDEIDRVCDGNKRRERQLLRWHCGANVRIRNSLRRTRRRWAHVVCVYMWGRDYRRHKLLLLQSQQRKLRMVSAFARIIRRIVMPRFRKLPLRMQASILQFAHASAEL